MLPLFYSCINAVVSIIIDIQTIVDCKGISFMRTSMACSFLDVIMPLPPSPYWPFSGVQHCLLVSFLFLPFLNISQMQFYPCSILSLPLPIIPPIFPLMHSPLCLLGNVPFQKISIVPPWRVIGNSEEEGGLKGQNFLGNV